MTFAGEAASFLNALIIPDLVYARGGEIARMVAGYISPVLFIIAILIRTTRVQLDTEMQTGKWFLALRDILVWGTALGLYFGLGSLIIEFFNVIYSWSSGWGSIKAITDQLSGVLETMEKNDTGDGGFAGFVAGGVVYYTSMFVYILSLVAVTTIIAFLHLAQAVGFVVAFVWGLVVIPISISQGINLLKGWGMFVIFILIWPFIEAIGFGIIGGMFEASASTLASTVTQNPGFEQGTALLLFTSLNIIIVIIAIVTPYIANNLAANAPAGSSLLTGFVGGAMASVAAMAYVNQKTAGGFVKHGSDGKLTPGNISKGMGHIMNSLQGAETQRAPLHSDNSVASTAGSPGGGGGASSTTDAGGDTQASKQSRRGAIIQQNAASTHSDNSSAAENVGSADGGDSGSAPQTSSGDQEAKQSRRGAIIRQNATSIDKSSA